MQPAIPHVCERIDRGWWKSRSGRPGDGVSSSHWPCRSWTSTGRHANVLAAPFVFEAPSPHTALFIFRAFSCTDSAFYLLSTDSLIFIQWPCFFTCPTHCSFGSALIVHRLRNKGIDLSLWFPWSTWRATHCRSSVQIPLPHMCRRRWLAIDITLNFTA